MTAPLFRKAEIYLWAVLIGIDEYQAAGYKSLEGAVADANDMEDYLYKELYVPKDHINVLRNSQATRKGIISAIEALNVNPDIKVQDPILIYFAGHGCALDRPEDWTIGDSHIQGIVPHDMNTAGPDGKPIPAIPDYTISALLGRLASVKGDNIVRSAYLESLAHDLTKLKFRRLYSTAVTQEVGLGMSTTKTIPSYDALTPRTSRPCLQTWTKIF